MLINATAYKFNKVQRFCYFRIRIYACNVARAYLWHQAVSVRTFTPMHAKIQKEASWAFGLSKVGSMSFINKNNILVLNFFFISFQYLEQKEIIKRNKQRLKLNKVFYYYITTCELIFWNFQLALFFKLEMFTSAFNKNAFLKGSFLKQANKIACLCTCMLFRVITITFIII